MIAEGVRQDHLDEMKDLDEQFEIKRTEEQIAQLRLRKQISALEEQNKKQYTDIRKLEQEKEKLKENLDLFKSDIEKSTKLRLKAEQAMTDNNSEISML